MLGSVSSRKAKGNQYVIQFSFHGSPFFTPPLPHKVANQVADVISAAVRPDFFRVEVCAVLNPCDMLGRVFPPLTACFVAVGEQINVFASKQFSVAVKCALEEGCTARGQKHVVAEDPVLPACALAKQCAFLAFHNRDSLGRAADCVPQAEKMLGGVVAVDSQCVVRPVHGIPLVSVAV